MYANHPKMAKKWSAHTKDKNLPDRVEELAFAATQGPVELALAEVVQNKSIALVIVNSSIPGKNICNFIRSLTPDRTRVIVCSTNSSVPGSFEKLLRASMPDCEKKIRVMDYSGSSLSDILNSAQRNKHYSTTQALEIFCDQSIASSFNHDVNSGSLKFDPTVIRIIPTKIPVDSSDDIKKAILSNDRSAQHRVLDPHVFSSPESLADFKSNISESFLIEAKFTAQSVIPMLVALKMIYPNTEALGEGHNGIAFQSVDPNKIVKVTAQQAEVKTAQKVIGRNIPGIVKVFNIKKLETVHSRANAATEVWAIEIEKLHHLPEDVQEKLDDTMSDLLEQYFTNSHSGPTDFAKFITRQDVMQTLNSVVPGIDVIFRSAKAIGFVPDVKGGNVMLNSSNKPTLSDIGPLTDLQEYKNNFLKKVTSAGNKKLNEFGTGSPGSGANGPANMKGSNSSSWSTGVLALKDPKNHVPEDENADENDRALDWGPGRVAGSSF